MSNHCLMPAYYKVQLALLRMVRDGLISDLNELSAHVNRLESIITHARQLAWGMAGQAGLVLGAKSGIERGKWAYNRGVYELCSYALAWLDVGERPALVWTARPTLKELGIDEGQLYV